MVGCWKLRTVVARGLKMKENGVVTREVIKMGDKGGVALGNSALIGPYESEASTLDIEG